MSTPNLNRHARGWDRKPGSSYRCPEKRGNLRCHQRIGHLGDCRAPQGAKMMWWFCEAEKVRRASWPANRRVTVPIE